MIDKKIPVSPRALLQRINRKLAAQGRVVHKLKPSSRNFTEFGPYWMLEGNTVVDGCIDLERLAKKLGSLGAWEVIVK